MESQMVMQSDEGINDSNHADQKDGLTDITKIINERLIREGREDVDERVHVHFATPLSVYHEYTVSQESSQTESIISESPGSTLGSLSFSQDSPSDKNLVAKATEGSPSYHEVACCTPSPNLESCLNDSSKSQIDETVAEFDIVTEVRVILDNLIDKCCESDNEKCNSSSKLNKPVLDVPLKDENFILKDNVAVSVTECRDINRELLTGNHDNNLFKAINETNTDCISKFNIYKDDTEILMDTNRNVQMCGTQPNKPDVFTKCLGSACYDHFKPSSSEENSNLPSNPNVAENKGENKIESSNNFCNNENELNAGLMNHQKMEILSPDNSISYEKHLELNREQNSERLQIMQPLSQTSEPAVSKEKENNNSILVGLECGNNSQSSNINHEPFEIFDSDDESDTEATCEISSVSQTAISKVTEVLTQAEKVSSCEISSISQISISENETEMLAKTNNAAYSSNRFDNESDSSNSITPDNTDLGKEISSPSADTEESSTGHDMRVLEQLETDIRDTQTQEAMKIQLEIIDKENMSISQEKSNSIETLNLTHYESVCSKPDDKDYDRFEDCDVKTCETLTSLKVKEVCDEQNTEVAMLNSKIKVFGKEIREKVAVYLGESVLDQCIYKTLEDVSANQINATNCQELSLKQAGAHTLNSEESVNEVNNVDTRNLATNVIILEEERSFCLNKRTLIDNFEKAQDKLPSISSQQMEKVSVNVAFDETQTNENLQIDTEELDYQQKETNMLTISEELHSEQLHEKPFGMYIDIKQTELGLKVQETTCNFERNMSVLNIVDDTSVYINQKPGKKRWKEHSAVEDEPPAKLQCNTMDSESRQNPSEENVKNIHEEVVMEEQDQSVPEMSLLHSSDVEENLDGFYIQKTDEKEQVKHDECSRACIQGQDISKKNSLILEKGNAGQAVFRWKYAPSIELDSVVPSIDEEANTDPSFVPHPLKTCKKPYRTGLSKKQKLSSLHPKLKTV